MLKQQRLLRTCPVCECDNQQGPRSEWSRDDWTIRECRDCQMVYLENAVDYAWRRFPNSFRGYTSRLAKLLGLRYVILNKPFAAMPPHVPRPKAELLHQADGFYLYRLEGSQQPRASLASAVKPAALAEALRDTELPEFDPVREALIEPSDLGKLSPALGAAEANGGAPGRALVVDITANSVTIEAESNHPALLVLHDSYYAGWTAEVNGAPRPVVRANLLFRGVEIGAGQSRVVFRFRPLSLQALGETLRNVLGRRAAP